MGTLESLVLEETDYSTIARPLGCRATHKISTGGTLIIDRLVIDFEPFGTPEMSNAQVRGSSLSNNNKLFLALLKNCCFSTHSPIIETQKTFTIQGFQLAPKCEFWQQPTPSDSRMLHYAIRFTNLSHIQITDGTKGGQ